MMSVEGNDRRGIGVGSVPADVLAGLARRLAVGDGSLAAAGDLRRCVRELGGEAAPALRRSAWIAALVPPLGVALARAALGAPVGTVAAEVPLGTDDGRASALVITPSADLPLAAACARSLPAATVIFVGGARPDASLRSALGARNALRCADVAEASIAAGGPTLARVSFHGLDGRALEAAAREFGRPARLDLNAPPSDEPVPPAPAVDCDWSEEGLRRAVHAIETPEVLGTPGVFARHMRTFSYGWGRSYLRLDAGADPAECARALDCLVAMRHVWIVSVDPSHDPRLIERVAHDAAFCEVQTRDVFLDFVMNGDRVRVLGPSPPPAPWADASFFVGPLSPRPDEEIRRHYVRQLLRVGLPCVIGPARLALGCAASWAA